MSSPLANFLVRAIYPFGSVRRVWRGATRFAKYVVSPGMGFTYAFGLFDGGMRFLERRLKPGMTVFDIGANRGQMAIFFAMRVGKEGKVFCFEPVPAVHDVLLRNIALNGFTHVFAHRLAIAEKSGHAEFIFAESDSTEGRLAQVADAGAGGPGAMLAVETRSLDEFVAQAGVIPDLIKIDVEGGGALVLAGAARLLDEHAPAIYMEFHGPDEQRGVAEHLLTRGYTLENLAGEEVADPTAGWNGTLWCYRKRAPARPMS